MVDGPRQEVHVKLNRLARMAKELVDKNGDKIAAGVNKATDLVDKKTKGKHHQKLVKIDDMARKLDKGKDDRDPDGPGPDRPASG